MSNILVWLMIGFLAGLFARKAGEVVESLVKSLSRVRLEIDVHSDKPPLQPDNIEPLQIPARTGRRKRTDSSRIDTTTS